MTAGMHHRYCFPGAVGRGIRTRLTFGPIFNNTPLWSPDGKWIAYTSNRTGKFQLFRKPSDGGGAEEELLSDDQLLFPGDWSHDGKYIIYGRGTPGVQDIWALPLEGDRKPFQVVPTTPGTFRKDPKLSPDGRWLAYVSNESGTEGVYVSGFRGGIGKSRRTRASTHCGATMEKTLLCDFWEYRLGNAGERTKGCPAVRCSPKLSDKLVYTRSFFPGQPGWEENPALPCVATGGDTLTVVSNCASALKR